MKRTILILLLVVLILSACGGRSDVPTPDPTEALKTVAGKYFVQITAEDLERSGQTDPDLASTLGIWEFSLGEDGKLIGRLNGSEIGTGNFRFQGHEMIIGVERCENCGCEKNHGRYSWAADETQLVLKEIYDLCDNMVFILTAKPLVRR